MPERVATLMARRRRRTAAAILATAVLAALALTSLPGPGVRSIVSRLPALWHDRSWLGQLTSADMVLMAVAIVQIGAVLMSAWNFHRTLGASERRHGELAADRVPMSSAHVGRHESRGLRRPVAATS
jgi:hypothetical protein